MTVLFVAKDAVNVNSTNFFVGRFEMNESAEFLEFTLINNTWWTKESVIA
jgi:hypothetical protein